MAFWFTWHGILDVKRLFHDLKHRAANDLDNGMVDGNVSFVDNAPMETAEKEK